MPPLKSISVTPIKRGGGRQQPSPTIDDSDEGGFSISSPLARPARRVVAAPSHRYRVGEHLKMNGGGQSVARSAGSCKVVSRLPYEGLGSLPYRVRSDTESFERVVPESDLTR